MAGMVKATSCGPRILAEYRAAKASRAGSLVWRSRRVVSSARIWVLMTLRASYSSGVFANPKTASKSALRAAMRSLVS